MGRAFVDLFCRGGVATFEFGSLDMEPSQEDDAKPDLSIRDTAGAHRVSVETFRRDVDRAQTTAYLKALRPAPYELRHQTAARRPGPERVG